MKRYIVVNLAPLLRGLTLSTTVVFAVVDTRSGTTVTLNGEHRLTKAEASEFAAKLNVGPN